MDALVSARTALLLALRAGPSYGVFLTRRVRESTSDHVRLGHGNVYVALRGLVREGLARSWTVVPGRRRGARARRYYELTLKGIAVTQAQRQALRSLLAVPVTAPSEKTAALMRSRLESCAQLSADVLELRDKMREAMA
jgi:DNA-binding PadR family transcriptional regulator